MMSNEIKVHYLLRGYLQLFTEQSSQAHAPQNFFYSDMEGVYLKGLLGFLGFQGLFWRRVREPQFARWGR